MISSFSIGRFRVCRGSPILFTVMDEWVARSTHELSQNAPNPRAVEICVRNIKSGLETRFPAVNIGRRTHRASYFSDVYGTLMATNELEPGAYEAEVIPEGERPLSASVNIWILEPGQYRGLIEEELSIVSDHLKT